jgi:UDP-glucose 4-epimerase
MRYVVTGGNGFFGRILVECLLRRGEEVLAIDRLADPSAPAGVRFARADLRDFDRLYQRLREFQPIDGVFHVAAILAHEKKDRFMLWDSNVHGTGNLLGACVRLGVPKLVFTSSNCIFGRGSKSPVDESAPPHPVEIYGRSKLEAERRIVANGPRLPYSIVRCPTIVGAGRLGLLAILFDFIRENRRWATEKTGISSYTLRILPRLVCWRCGIQVQPNFSTSAAILCRRSPNLTAG